MECFIPFTKWVLGGMICTLEVIVLLLLLGSVLILLSKLLLLLCLAAINCPPEPGVCEVTTVASAPTHADSVTTSPVDRTILADWWETAAIPVLPKKQEITRIFHAQLINCAYLPLV